MKNRNYINSYHAYRSLKLLEKQGVNKPDLIKHMKDHSVCGFDESYDQSMAVFLLR